MTWMYVTILACFLCASGVNAGDSATKTIHITVNLLPVNEEVMAQRVEVCKRPKYRYHATCRELALSNALRQAASLSEINEQDSSPSSVTQLVGPQSRDASTGVDEQSKFAMMAVMLTSSDELDGGDGARRANFLSEILELEPISALEMAQDNNLSIDDSSENTRVTIIGI